jgi:hypothetical protein
VRLQYVFHTRWHSQTKADGCVSKAPRHHVAPIHLGTLDVPFSAPIACTRRLLTTSPLTLRNFSDHDELSHSDQGQTHPPTSDNKSPLLCPVGSSSTLLTPLSNAPQSDPGQHSSLKPSRPSIVVYKVATGPNLAGTRDVIRVSYGEGHRKWTRSTSSRHRIKERHLSGQAYTPNRYGNTKRDDTEKLLNRKVIRSKIFAAQQHYDDKYLVSPGLRRANSKASSKSRPAERLEGDMAWDFGAGSEKCQRRVDADRTQVRVGGLTRVRMTPRPAVDGEIGPKAAP